MVEIIRGAGVVAVGELEVAEVVEGRDLLEGELNTKNIIK